MYHGRRPIVAVPAQKTFPRAERKWYCIAVSEAYGPSFALMHCMSSASPSTACAKSCMKGKANVQCNTEHLGSIRTGGLFCKVNFACGPNRVVPLLHTFWCELLVVGLCEHKYVQPPAYIGFYSRNAFKMRFRTCCCNKLTQNPDALSKMGIDCAGQSSDQESWLTETASRNCFTQLLHAIRQRERYRTNCACVV